MVAEASGTHRWAALVVIAGAQLMVALDATIVSVALPAAQRDLHLAGAERPWMVSAYTLAFGALLLAGGRAGDRLGRRRTFLAGLAGFALASALGGAASSLAVLVAARAAQGACAALLTPTALSLLATTFVEARERARAFAVYGAVAGSGAALGLMLGGLLTQYLSWRWCLYVNLPIALAVAAGAWAFVGPTPSRARPRAGFDWPGLALGCGAMAVLVVATVRVPIDGWRSPDVAGVTALSLLLLACFVVRERVARDPLLPLSVVLDRQRGGAYLAILLAAAGIFGAFLFLTYYLQVVLRYSPLQAGMAFLPMAVASQVGSWAVARPLLPRLPARALIAPGALVAAAGMTVLARLDAGAGYAALVLPAEVLLGLGVSCVMVPAFSVGTLGVDASDSGAAAAAASSAQQVGASLGTALLNAVAVGAAAGYLAQRPSAGALGGLVHGFQAAALCGAVVFAVGALTAAGLVTAANSRAPSQGAATMSLASERPFARRLQARVMGIVNVPMRAILGLPFPTPLSRNLMLVTLTGRRSGRVYRQPLSYVRHDGSLLTPGGGRWKLNLRPDEPVEVRLGGRAVAARAEQVREIAEVERLLNVMTAANPTVGRFVAVPRRPDGRLDPARLRQALDHGFSVVRWRLEEADS